ncbi:MAG: hypothetical protein ACXWE6_13185 [Nitrososphaeraceae archaeon]
MKKWFASYNGAVILSSAALLAFIGYIFMEMRYTLGNWIPGNTAAMVETVVILLIIGGWLRALFVTASGRRAGLIASLIFSLFIIIIAIYDMKYVIFYETVWPLKLMVIIMLIVGIIVAVTTSVQLAQNRKVS